MGYWNDLRTVARDALMTRAGGGMVDSYMVGGDDISLCPIDKLATVILPFIERMAEQEQAQETGGRSRISLGVLTPP